MSARNENAWEAYGDLMEAGIDLTREKRELEWYLGEGRDNLTNDEAAEMREELAVIELELRLTSEALDELEEELDI